MQSTTPISLGPLPQAPLVSILMPAFNAGEFISKAIESTIDQTYGNWEFLILDDASTDDTLKIIQSFKDDRIRVFEHAENQGYLRSCNELFKKANGDLITFLDADDLSSKNRLESCVAEFRNTSDLGFLTSDHIRIDRNGTTIADKHVMVDYDRYAKDPDHFPYLACSTIMARSEILGESELYHSFFDRIGGEDYHLLFKLSLVSKGKHLAAYLYHYRQHPGQNQAVIKNPLQLYFQDINQQIRTAWVKEQLDLLANSEALLVSWNKRLSQIPTEIEFRKALHLTNRGKTSAGFEVATRALLSNFLSFRIWRKYALFAYSILYRTVR